MRLAISVLAILLAIAPLDARDSRNDPALTSIRPMQKDAARLVADGIAHSPTFRRLIDHLERSNVIVYIDLRPDMPLHRGGALRFLARSATDHFVKIHLNRVFSNKTLVALLGHELQHAVEVAATPQIVDPASLAREYTGNVGYPTFDWPGARQTYDSHAANEIGTQVLKELTQN